MNFKLIYVILFLNCFSFYSSAHVMDSLRVEKIKGKKFIVHQVAPKETLYAIARHYNVSVDDIYKFNADAKSGLNMFDEILIPISKKKKNNTSKPKSITHSYHIVKKGETLFALSRQYKLSIDSLVAYNDLEQLNISIGDTIYTTPRVPLSKDTKEKSADSRVLIHVVKASETLFSISKLYEVEIDQIQEWNNLESNSLSIGQELYVSQPNNTAKITKEPLVKDSIVFMNVAPKPSLDTTFVKTDNSQFKRATEQIDGETIISEEGFAMKIEDTDYTKKFLALHRTVPLGAVIQVTNEMTHKQIDVRVVGKLPMSSLNKKLLLRLSAAAFKELGALDMKIPVTVSYEEN